MTLLHRATYPNRQAAGQAVLDGLASWSTFGEIAVTYSPVEGGAVLVVVERTDRVFDAGAGRASRAA